MIMEEIHYTLLVPAVVNALLKHPKVDQFDLSKVRAITIGAAPPSLWSVQELKRRWGIEFGNIWGQNEGTGNIAGPSSTSPTWRCGSTTSRSWERGDRTGSRRGFSASST